MKHIGNKKEINNWIYVVKETDNKIQYEVIPDKVIKSPEIVYKYYPLTQNSCRVLKNKQIYASHPVQLNDPFDCNNNLINYKNVSLDFCRKFFKSSIPDDEIINRFNVDKNGLINQLSIEHYIGVFSRLGVISMTEDSLNMLMWAYYASSHAGFALSFDTSQLKSKFHGPFPMNYLEIFEQLEFNEEEIYIDLLYQTNVKSINWQHEKEWRFIAEKSYMKMPGFYEGNDTVERTFDIENKIINGVIYGYKFFNYLIDFDKPSHTRRINFKYDRDKDYKMEILKHTQWITKKEMIVVEGVNSFKLKNREVDIKIINDNEIDLIVK
ncbi:MAG: DUF2971 domain-containing protein [Bacteroidales bacterium]|nr:DUF2971 domain-containing protein [Bacteroidales bacterium]